MHPILRNILAVLIGAVIGGMVNMGLLSLLMSINPPPEGFDPQNMAHWTEKQDLLEFRHYMTPFIAHALGTLVGAFLAVKIGISKHVTLAMVIGMFFLLVGIMMAITIGGPMWFTCLDLVVAYFPMAWLGYKLAGGNR